MRILVLVARILLGLTFFIFGLNKIVTFIHMHGWLRLYGTAEAACGLMLLAGRFVPLALTILAGIGLNILLFHLTLEPGGIYLPLFLAILEVILVFAYREYFRGIFTGKATPTWR
jgi:putative oxidoreductase